MLLRRRGVLGLLLCREVVEVEELTWTFGLSVFEYRWLEDCHAEFEGVMA